MADTKISDLTALTGANVADDDEFVIVDTSAAQSKRITRAELAQGLYQGDNVRLKIGASSDLQLYHDGTHSYISDQGTGNLRIAASDRIQFYNAATDEVTAQFIANGEAELRYDNTTRLSTTSTGIDVTGTVTADGLTVDTSDPVLRLTDSDTGETATVKTSGAGHLILDASQANAAGNGNVYVRTQASTLRALFNYNGDIAFYDSTGTSQNLFWDASASRLGIGVTAPSQVLHVKDSSTNAYARVTATTNTGIDFGQETNGNGLINLRDSASLRIFTSGTERMRLTSAGLLVGKTAQALATVGAEILGSIGRIQATRDSGAPGGFNRKTNDGDIVAFYKDATQVGSIGNHDATSAYIGSSDTGLRFNVGSDSVTPYDPSTKANRDAAIDLGHPSIRFKDLYLSGIAKIGTTSSFSSNVKLALQSNCSAGVMAEFNNTNTTSTDNIIRFRRNGTEAGRIAVTTSNTTQYLTSSDYRIKENVTELTGAIDRVKQVPVHRFNFIVDPDNTVDGFLAHEVQTVVPEAISGEKDGMRNEEYEVTPAVLDDDGNVVTEAVIGTREVPDYQAIDQSKLVPLLTAALKEAIAKIETLENRISILEGAN